MCTLTVDDHTSRVGRQALHARRRADPDRATASRSSTRKGRRSYVTSAGAGPVDRQAHPDELPAARARRRRRAAAGRVHGRALPGDGRRRPTRRRCSTPTTRASGSMNILVCVKRVPLTGGKIVLTDDERAISDAPSRLHGQPARGVRRRGGGPAGRAARRLVDRADARPARGRGAAARHDGDRRRPRRSISSPTAASGIRRRPRRRSSRRSAPTPSRFDLILFGNESADAGNYQVAIRVAHALGLPCVDRRQGDRGRRRRASLRAGGRRRARRLRRRRCRPWSPSRRASTCRATRRCRAGCAPSASRVAASHAGAPRAAARDGAAACCPRARGKQAQVLGHGADAAPAVVRGAAARLGLV